MTVSLILLAVFWGRVALSAPIRQLPEAGAHAALLCPILGSEFPIYAMPFITPCAAAAAAKLLQSCPTLCDPIDSSPPGFPVPGILQARTLEWVAISFSNAGK